MVLGQDSPLDTKILVICTGLESSNMLNKLAIQMLKHVGNMSESEMLSKIDGLTTSDARTQMFVGIIRYGPVLSFVLLFCSRWSLFFPDSDAGMSLGLLLTVTQGYQ